MIFQRFKPIRHVRSPATPAETHVAAPASTNYERLAAKSSTKGWLLRVRAHDPSGLALAVCELRAVGKSVRKQGGMVGWLSITFSL